MVAGLEQAAILHLVLDLTRILSAGVLRRKRFGASADYMLLLCAVGVGELEGRPLTAHKLADQAGIPRPSVVRKLAEMEATGLVHRLKGGAYTLAPGVLDSPEAVAALRAAAKRVTAVAGVLG